MFIEAAARIWRDQNGKGVTGMPRRSLRQDILIIAKGGENDNVRFSHYSSEIR